MYNINIKLQTTDIYIYCNKKFFNYDLFYEIK